MEQKMIKELFLHLSNAPDGIVAHTIAPEFKKLAEQKKDITADDLIDLLDDCVFGALVNTSTMYILDVVWKNLGGNTEQANIRRKVMGRI